MNQLIKDKLALLPILPGCYLMKDKQNQIIYVGKAKKLKNRVKSYFTGSHNGKTARLVSEIVDFDYVVTSSELEALVLELNLIKKHDPKYNIMLTDDKHYPYIKLTNEVHPRLLMTRKIKKDRSKYFGPFPNARAASETIRLLNKLYPLRKCHPIPKKFCLYYHIHQCLGPCEQTVDEEVYKPYIEGIIKFLKGDFSTVKNDLVEKMMDASEKLEFERAKEYRDLINHIEATVEKQKISSNDFVDRDIFGYEIRDEFVCVHVFFARLGKVNAHDTFIFEAIEDPQEAILTFISRFYDKHQLKPKEIMIPSTLNEDLLRELLDVKIVVPKIGEKKQLVDLAMENANVALEQKIALLQKQEERTIKAVEALGDLLYIPIPHRIEAFDNSHISGVEPVSAMVVFTDGRPNKKEYRKYKIKTATNDDYQAMREVVYRRYFKVLNEDLPRPDLIVIDGGKGQVSAAQEVLDSLGMQIPVIGLVKDSKHRTDAILDGRDMEVIKLKKSLNVFALLTRIQDEVHRFAITFHQKSHQKRNLTSILDEIPGVGEKRRRKLVQNFNTLEKMLNASDEEYATLGFPPAVVSRIRIFIKEELDQSAKKGEESMK